MARRSLRALSAALCLIAQPVLAEGPVQGPVQGAAQGEADLPDLAVMGTVPLYWGEADGIADLVQGRAEPHWARSVLERTHTLLPLDRLDRASLQGHQRLLLAQPRALTAAENVALDDWVRGGGQVLLFADPMLTGESRFGLGDRRRPQDVILLSPILTRWGLRLDFADDQPVGVRFGEIAGQPVPVNLPGRLAVVGDGSSCRLEAGGIAASCAIGAGQALVWADAAVLDLHHPDPASAAALAALVQRAFADSRETAGRSVDGTRETPENSHFEAMHAQQEPSSNAGPDPG